MSLDLHQHIERDTDGSSAVTVTGPTTAFGELAVAPLTPVLQIDAVNGAMPGETLTRVEGAGVAGDDDEGQFVASLTAANGDYAEIMSKRKLRYHPGQGALGRMTATFAAPVASSFQFAGLINPVSAIGFGHDGAYGIGVLHRTGGEVENQLLTITAAGAGTAALTLDGVVYNVPTTGTSIASDAFEVQEWFNTPENQTIWHAAATNGTICFLAYSAGVKSGTYSVGGTGITAALTQQRAGKANVDTWAYSSSDDAVAAGADQWNIDPMDGFGPSGYKLDPLKINVYAVQFQYLGGGPVIMTVEDGQGVPQPVHRFDFNGKLTAPSLRNPSFSIGWCVQSLGSTTAMTIKGASAAGFIEGIIHPLSLPHGAANQITCNATLKSAVAIRVRHSFKFRWLLNEVIPAFATASAEGTKNVQASLILNPTFVDPPDWQFVDSAGSFVEVETSGGEISGGVVLSAISMAKHTNIQVSLEELGNMALQVDDVLAIGVQILNGNNTPVDGAFTWYHG